MRRRELPEPGLGARGRLLVALFVLFYGVVLLRTAWLSDDAYITFRTIDNFQNGYGLTWNVSERVQVFTHPLWALIVSAIHSYTKEFYLTCIVLSILLSLLTAALVGFGIARSLPGAVLGVSILALSKAFVDYSTSRRTKSTGSARSKPGGTPT